MRGQADISVFLWLLYFWHLANGAILITKDNKMKKENISIKFLSTSTWYERRCRKEEERLRLPEAEGREPGEAASHTPGVNMCWAQPMQRKVQCGSSFLKAATKLRIQGGQNLRVIRNGYQDLRSLWPTAWVISDWWLLNWRSKQKRNSHAAPLPSHSLDGAWGSGRNWAEIPF